MPPIEVLYRLRRRRPDVFDKLEGESLSFSRAVPHSYGFDRFLVYIDGTFRDYE